MEQPMTRELYSYNPMCQPTRHAHPIAQLLGKAMERALHMPQPMGLPKGHVHTMAHPVG